MRRKKFFLTGVLGLAIFLSLFVMTAKSTEKPPDGTFVTQETDRHLIKNLLAGQQEIKAMLEANKKEINAMKEEIVKEINATCGK